MGIERIYRKVATVTAIAAIPFLTSCKSSDIWNSPGSDGPKNGVSTIKITADNPQQQITKLINEIHKRKACNVTSIFQDSRDPTEVTIVTSQDPCPPDNQDQSLIPKIQLDHTAAEEPAKGVIITDWKGLKEIGKLADRRGCEISAFGPIVVYNSTIKKLEDSAVFVFVNDKLTKTPCKITN